MADCSQWKQKIVHQSLVLVSEITLLTNTAASIVILNASTQLLKHFYLNAQNRSGEYLY
jgi:hypothetical protein